MALVIGPLIVVAVVVAVITSPPDDRQDAARTTLDRRLAEGAITADEHREQAALLRQPRRRLGRWIVAGTGVALLLAGLFLTGRRATDQMTSMMKDNNMMNGMDMMNGMMGFGWIGMLLVLGLVIALVVWLIGRLSPDDQRSPVREARGILDDRFARGEIDRDEYAERRDALDR